MTALRGIMDGSGNIFGWPVMETTDWARLFHAYGMAEDTPDQLRNLISGDARLRVRSVDHLSSAILHQGTIYPATPAAVRVVAGILNEPLLRERLDDGSSTLRSAIAFLGEVGASLNDIGSVEPQPQPREADLAELPNSPG